MWSGEEWIPVPPESESGEPEGNPESSIDGGNLTLQDSVVDGDVSNVTNLGQDKVVHGVNIERIVVSQSLVDSYGIEKITSGMKTHFSANSEVEVDGDLSELMDKLRAVIENIEEDDQGQIGSISRDAVMRKMFFPDLDLSHAIGHTKENLLSELEFLQFGQKYHNAVHAQKPYGIWTQIELLGFNHLRNHIIVEVHTGSGYGKVKWDYPSRICAITIGEFCDYYRGLGNVIPRLLNFGTWTNKDLKDAKRMTNSGGRWPKRSDDTGLPDANPRIWGAFNAGQSAIPWNRREIKM